MIFLADDLLVVLLLIILTILSILKGIGVFLGNARFMFVKLLK